MPTGVYPRTVEQYQTRIGRPSPQKGRKRTPEQCERIGAAHVGQEPWNKGTKGLQSIPRNAFKPGSTPWNKGISWPSVVKERIAKTLNNKRDKQTPHGVYYLIDPITMIPRYVGFSEKPQARFEGHIKHLRGSTHKVRWINSLLAISLRPILSIRCIVASKLEACRIETALIALLRARDVDLTNATPGGEGGATMTGHKRINHNPTDSQFSPRERLQRRIVRAKRKLANLEAK